jgi:hypothetical protein
MHFTNVRSIQRQHVNIITSTTDNYKGRLFPMRMYNTSRTHVAPIVVQPSVSTIDPTKKILWGPPTWYFFHTLAEKVKPELFLQHRAALFGMIKDICKNLPCPTCSAHASQYIDKINVNSLQSKHDLIKMLFEFHNNVNARTNSPQFSYDELLSKYKQANFVNIVNNFMYYYKMEHHAIRMIADDMYRKRSAKSIIDWLHAHRDIFV